MPGRPGRTSLFSHLYLQVLVAIVVGVALGYFYPAAGAATKPVGDAFVRLIKMMIAPVVFTTVALGIAKAGDAKRVARVGLKAVVYFELVSTLALAIGLGVVNLVRPGVGINADVATLDRPAAAGSGDGAGPADLLLRAVPESAVGAFAGGGILQVLTVSVLFGLALGRAGDRARALADILDQLARVVFGVIGIVMRLAPVGAFGAMAFTVGKYGVGTLLPLGELVACVYGTCLLFVVGVLGLAARLAGFGLWPFLRYIREEVLVVLGTSSSEAALPGLMTKLENVGCDKSVVGLVVPTGYSFNLDGTSIYLTTAAVFLAQATNTPLGLGDQLGLLGVLLVTSKGAAAVTGGGFVALAATLEATGTVPAAALTLLLGVDRFLSEVRAVTNLIGNGVATMVVARWEGALDLTRARSVLASGSNPATDDPAAGRPFSA